MSLSGKKLIVAVTGSIAAYKTPHLVRLLVKAGAEVKVLMTEAAKGFVTPLALSTVSRQPALSDVHDGASWNNHVALGIWADAMLIAPCSANSLAKLANGLCDNLVSAVYLSARCPVFIAPAMDEDMWLHPATRQNVRKVAENGNTIIPVGHGELASGLVGEGRMAEPEHILAFLIQQLSRHLPLIGKRALVTAGPTYEKLDPVRFIGNFSTGKMGVALAEALAASGADVTLVCGPMHDRPAGSTVKVIPVVTAAEMYAQCTSLFAAMDIAIMAAAVADYRPVEESANKIKKTDNELQLTLVKTQDILAALGVIKTTSQTLVGFALETANELDNARKKLMAKNADMIVLNSLNDVGAGFGHDTNKVTLLENDGMVTPLPLMTKQEVATAIVERIIKKYYVEEAV